MADTMQKAAWGVRGCSTRGASHFRSGLPNQDSLGIWSDDSHSRAIVVVSDGHGSARHFRSDQGSHLATEAAISVLKGVSFPISEDEARALSRPIVDAWRTAVKAHLAEHPFVNADYQHVPAGEREQVDAAIAENPVVAYGATLLATLATDTDLLFLQLGDGDILCIGNEGATTRPMKEDGRLIANQTTSLCQNEAPDNFRVALLHAADTPLPVLILMSSDGYSNSFHTDEDFLQVGTDYLALLRQYGADKVEAQLEHILSEASRQGSGDDITLGMLERTAGATPAVVAPTRPAVAEPAVTSKSAPPQSQPVATARAPLPVIGKGTAAGDGEQRLRRNLMTYRVALAAVILLAAAGIALAWYRPPQLVNLFHKAAPEQPASAKTAPAKTAPAPVAARPVLALQLPDGEHVTLKTGILNATQLRLKPPYHGAVLEVESEGQDLLLRNRSGKEWSAAGPEDDKPHSLDIHETVPVRKGQRVFLGAVALLVIPD
ncbi:MAG TPA: PP2C family serine/threonine-protein phosphatase [Bryobacteraceae bacterium]|jgi:hypothetical protein|nr:PP2C family serine/threonine-protein phosphatase [Bryobacteraceae bacterium]